jgi:prepilin-type N-terminal cleavage/methylation domain-containing protein
MKKNGFTLVELLIVMSIVAILGVILTGIINPVALIAKSHDSRRKSDLNKIKTSFEEYFNDRGQYPVNVSSWNTKDNCGKSVTTDFINNYVKNWPCDPNGNVYRIDVDAKKFRVIINLENKTDKDIPNDWYLTNNYILVGFTKDQANYGISSSNIYWYDWGETKTVDPNCNKADCWISKNGCNKVQAGQPCSSGSDCYYGNASGCITECRATEGCVGQ